MTSPADDGAPRPESTHLEATPAGRRATGALTISVVAYASRYQTIVQVPAQVPTGTLVDQLGGPVGVTQVSKLLLLDGTPISLDSTLDEVGVGDGSSILVLSVYDAPPGEDASAANDAWLTLEQRSGLSGAQSDGADRPPELPPTPARPPADDPMWGAGAASLPARGAAEGTTDRTEVDVQPEEDARANPPAVRASPLVTPSLAEATTEDLTPAAADVASPRRATTRRRRRAAGVGAAALAVALGGGVLVGRATAPSPSAPGAAVLSAARQAATTWMEAKAYPPATVADGASPSAGRVGGLTGGTRTVGWTMRGDETDVWFIVSPKQKAPVGLTVQLDGSKLTGAPSVSPLPFGGGQVPPHAPGPPAKGSTTPMVLTRWARQTFGPAGQLTATLGAGLVGKATVVAASSSGSASMLYRVRLALSSSAAGTPAHLAAMVLARDQANVGTLQRAMSTAHTQVAAAEVAASRDGAAVAAASATATNDANAVKQANAANAAASQALAQANAANAAHPIPPASLEAAQAASTSAGQTLAAAQAELAKAQAQLDTAQAQQEADQATVTSDRAKLSADQSSLSAAEALRTAAQARIPAAFTAVGTYDIWIVAGHVKGWVPAGFEGV